MSPFKADQQLMNSEMAKLMKDETRHNFSSLVENFPAITKKATKVKISASPGPVTNSKKVKRKASIPAPVSQPKPRQAQSVGPTAMQTDASQDEFATAAKTSNASMTRGTTNKSSVNYPSYFFKPKENIFDSKRGSKYFGGDKSVGGISQPKAFHLTQVDSNLAKTVFLSKVSKRPLRDTQSVQNNHEFAPPVFSTLNSAQQ